MRVRPLCRVIGGVVVFATAVTMASPAGATHGGADNAGCVAQFVTGLPPERRGPVISYGAHHLQPFGAEIVSVQAARPRDDCLHFEV